MKIFTSALEAETNTFSPIPTGLTDFHVIRLDALKNGVYPFPDEDVISTLWQRKARDRGDQFYYGLGAFAKPAGPTAQSIYEDFRDEILASLKACPPVDVVLLYLHGAMVAHGYEDCEGDLLARIRTLVGSKVIIAAELDLHCHLTDKMRDSADILISYKEYPHTDMVERADEVFDLAILAASGGCRPTMAFFDCKLVGMYPTSTPAMRSFIDEMLATEKMGKVLSVSFLHGFPYGDVHDAGGKILVITDNAQPLAEYLAEKLGRKIVGLRDVISFKPLSLEHALDKAVSILADIPYESITPVVVADQSDNAGGGAPSDSTYALRWLLDHKVKGAAIAIFYDPQVVRSALSAGIGSELTVRLGGKMGLASGDPLDLVVRVKSIKPGYWQSFPQDGSRPVLAFLGDTVALQCEGIDIVVSTERSQCYSYTVFDDLGIPSRERKLLVVKSAQHFYGSFVSIAHEIIYMAGPGAVPPVVEKIKYRRMSTQDKYPWIENPLGE